MGKIIFHTVDQLGVDQLGVDQLVVDQLGVDQLGCYPTNKQDKDSDY